MKKVIKKQKIEVKKLNTASGFNTLLLPPQIRFSKPNVITEERNEYKK